MLSMYLIHEQQDSELYKEEKSIFEVEKYTLWFEIFFYFNKQSFMLKDPLVLNNKY